MRYCYTSHDCKSGICGLYSAVRHECQYHACNDKLWNGNEADVDCGRSCANKCEPGYHCTDSTDCAEGLTCRVHAEYRTLQRPAFCVLPNAGRTAQTYEPDSFTSTISMAVTVLGTAKFKFSTLAFTTAVRRLLNSAEGSVHIDALHDHDPVAASVRDPYANITWTRRLDQWSDEAGQLSNVSSQRQAAEEPVLTDVLTTYMDGVDVQFSVLAESWEHTLIAQRMGTLLQLRLNATGTGLPCFAGPDSRDADEGTALCAQRSQVVDLQTRGQSPQWPGQALTDLLAEEGFNHTSIALLRVPREEAGSPSTFFRPASIELYREPGYTASNDTYAYAGEPLPVTPIVLARDRHARQVVDVFPDTKIKVYLNAKEFRPTYNSKGTVVIAPNPTHVAGITDRLLRDGAAFFTRIYVTKPINGSRLFFRMIDNPYMAEVPEISSRTLVLIERPAVVYVPPPENLMDPFLVFMLFACTLGAVLFCVFRVLRWRRWCTTPEPYKRVAKPPPPPEPVAMEATSYQAHDEQKELDEQLQKEQEARQAEFAEALQKSRKQKNVPVPGTLSTLVPIPDTMRNSTSVAARSRLRPQPASAVVQPAQVLQTAAAIDMLDQMVCQRMGLPAANVSALDPAMLQQAGLPGSIESPTGPPRVVTALLPGDARDTQTNSSDSAPSLVQRQRDTESASESTVDSFV